MKTFIVNLGWEGGYVVVARDEEHAREILKTNEEYKRCDQHKALIEIAPEKYYRFWGDT